MKKLKNTPALPAVFLLAVLFLGGCPSPASDGGGPAGDSARDLAGEINFVNTAADSSRTVFDTEGWEGYGTALESWRLGASAQGAVYFAVLKGAGQSLEPGGKDAERVRRAERGTTVDGSLAGPELDVFTVDTAHLGLEGGGLEFTLLVIEPEKEERAVKVLLDIRGGLDALPAGLYVGDSVTPVDLEGFFGDNPLTQTLSFLGRNAEANTAYTVILDGNIALPPLRLTKDEMKGKAEGISLALRGKGGERVIALAGQGSLFSISHLKLVVGDNITLKGRTAGAEGATSDNNKALVEIGERGTLELLEDAEISGNTNAATGGNGGGVLVNHSSALFALKGGTITGNAGPSVGGVYLVSGSFSMSGGTITGNANGGLAFYGVSYDRLIDTEIRLSGGSISGNGTRDVRFPNSYGHEPLFTLAGAARIGVLELGRSGQNYSSITLGRDFSGSVDRLNLTGDNSLANLKRSWKNAPVLKWAEGDGVFPVEKFTLGDFVGNTVLEPVGNDFHLDPDTGILVEN
jgi:hypothetical protein